MKKSLIAMAVAGIVDAPMAAQAETQVFGIMHMSAGMWESTDSTATPTTTEDNFQINSHASRLGVKGSHDLGGGMSGIYHIEYGVNPEGATVLTRRNQFAGIGASWGEVLIGNRDTPLKLSQGKFDQFGDRFGDLASISTGDTRNEDSITYVGKFGAIKVEAQVAASEGDGKKTGDPAAPGKGDSIADETSVAVSYSAGPLYVAVAMDSYDSTEGQETDSLTRVTATYAMGSMQLGLMVESGGYGDKTADKDVMGLSFKMGMGNNAVKVQYMTGEDSSTVPVEETHTSVGYDMGLSKQVTAYVDYSVYDVTVGSASGDTTFMGAGLEVKF